MNKSGKEPPKMAQRFLLWFLKDELAEEVQGDLEEMYEYQLSESGKRIANLNYWLQVINYLRPFALRHIKRPEPIYTAMYKNYFKVSLRCFARRPFYFLINALGLGIALSCCVAAYLTFAYDVEFDSFHDEEKVAQVYKVVSHEVNQRQLHYPSLHIPVPLGSEAKREVSGINTFTRYATSRGNLISGEKLFRENVAFVDTSFFEIFDFPLLFGNHQQIRSRNSVYISQELSQKLFGESNPVGKEIALTFNGEKELYLEVGGVLQKFPANNSFYFSALLPFHNYLEFKDIDKTSWGERLGPATFVKLDYGVNPDNVEQQLAHYIPIRNEARKDRTVESYQLLPFHYKFSGLFNSRFLRHDTELEGFLIFGSLALMILLIACFNAANISIALAAKRLKEIGVRKAMGAGREHIFGQFIAETFLVMISALLIGALLTPWFSAKLISFGSLDYSLSDLNGINLLISVIILVFFASAIAGIYPALFNSRLKPVVLMKGEIKIKGTNWVNRSLITVQFALCVIFLVNASYFVRNEQFYESLNYNFDMDRLIMIELDEEQQYRILTDAAREYPKIEQWGLTETHVGYYKNDTVWIEGKSLAVDGKRVGENYMETMGFKLKQGRLLDLQSASDRKYGIVVNEAFVKETGLGQVGDKLILNDSTRQIVGIIADHYDQASSSIEPMVFTSTQPDQYKSLVLKARTEDLEEVNDYMRKVWQESFPLKPYYGFLQEEVTMGYAIQNQREKRDLALFMAILGMLMSLAGIFALASLNVAKRTKEIGVRKVLGANISSLVSLVNREFTLIMLVASLLGSFAGAYLIELTIRSNSFRQNVPIEWLPVILSSLLIFTIGLLTTSSTVLRTALSNPVNTLRDE